MPRDYYHILGITREASADEIKRAYRKLAKQFHPDVNKGDKTAEERFKEVSEAYEVLSDPKKRQQYDMLGHAFAGGGPRPGPGGGYQWTSAGGDPQQWNSEMFGGEGLGDLFSELFGMGGVRTGRGAGARRAPVQPQRGHDIEGQVDVEFVEALQGTTVQIEIRRGGQRETISVRVPPGVIEGQKLRLTGKGEPGAHGGGTGDLYLTVHIRPHPFYRREGSDISADLPITIYEALLGGQVEVETPDGKAKMKIPAGTPSGQKFRIKGKGAPHVGKAGHGDFYAVIQIVPPKSIPKDLKEFAERLSTEAPYDPRK